MLWCFALLWLPRHDTLPVQPFTNSSPSSDHHHHPPRTASPPTRRSTACTTAEPCISDCSRAHPKLLALRRPLCYRPTPLLPLPTYHIPPSRAQRGHRHLNTLTTTTATIAYHTKRKPSRGHQAGALPAIPTLPSAPFRRKHRQTVFHNSPTRRHHLCRQGESFAALVCAVG